MKPLNIALFISEFEDPFSYSLCSGVIDAVKECGYNLYIFPGRFLDERMSLVFNDEFAYQNNCLYKFISKKNIDVAIVCLGNITFQLTAKEREQFIASLNVPTVLIANTSKKHSTVCYDNETGTIKGVEHLIHAHGKKHFGYVSGPRENIDACERRAAFEMTMQKNGFSPSDYKIVEGDFSYTSSDTIKELLDSFPQMDALVCANDLMCYSAYQLLKARGHKIGKDIAVLGYDNSPYSALIHPGLSTVKADPADLGYKAVMLCEDTYHGKIVHDTISTSMVFRASCGCDDEEIVSQPSDIINLQATMDSLNHTLVAITRNILNYEEENEHLYSAILNSLCQTNIQGAYLYTFTDEVEYKRGEPWEQPKYVKLHAYYNESAVRTPAIEYQPMPVYYYPIADGDIKEIPTNEQNILFTDILSNKFVKKSDPDIKVVTMLYAGETQYGFMLWDIQPSYFPYVGKLSYQISNVLKVNSLLHKKTKMSAALEQSLEQLRKQNLILDEISKVDELTQIYNRRGFLDSMTHNMILTENQRKHVITVYADTNNLKLINDKFGHDEGDYALKMSGQILREALRCTPGIGKVGRFGGDEFCAFLITNSENSEEILRKNIDEITERLNAESTKPYYVSVSVGMNTFICSENANISDELEQADIDLYKYKKHKRTNILKDAST